MTHPNTRGTVYLVTEKSPQTQLFVNYLEDKTGCCVRTQSRSASLTPVTVSNTLILIDSDHTDIDALVERQEKLPSDLANMPIAALNVHDINHALETLAQPYSSANWIQQNLDEVPQRKRAVLKQAAL